MTATLPPDTPPTDPPSDLPDRHTALAFPCDRCSSVAYLHQHRPGELLCLPCWTAARHDRSTR